MRRSNLLMLLMALFGIPSAFALDLPWSSGFSGSLSNPLNRFFRILVDFLQNDLLVYGFTFIFFFVLLYGIYAAALGRINVFKAGKGISKQGKIVGVSLSFLSCFGIFYFVGAKSIQDVLRDVLAPFGIFAGLVLGIVFFLIVYKGFEGDSKERAWKTGLAAAGLGMLLAGMIVSDPNIITWGFFIAMIGFVFLFIGLIGGGPSDEGPGKDTQFSFPGGKPRATAPSGEGPSGEEPSGGGPEEEDETEEPEPSEPRRPVPSPVPGDLDWYPVVEQVDDKDMKGHVYERSN